jgi:hypothetical protein
MRLSVFAVFLPLAASLPFGQVPLQSPGKATLSLPALDELALPLQQLLQLQSYVDSLPEKRLVKLSQDHAGSWITEGEKALLVFGGIRFIDVTEDSLTASTTAIKNDLSEAEAALPDHLAFNRTDLDAAFAELSVDRLKSTLKEFTSFRTRHYRSSTGRESQKFLLNLIKDIVSTKPELNITVREFEHNWAQNSIIVNFPPSSASAQDAPVVIVGAHQDSTNLLPFLPAPVRSSRVETIQIRADLVVRVLTMTEVGPLRPSKLFEHSSPLDLCLNPTRSSSTIIRPRKLDCWGPRRSLELISSKASMVVQCFRWGGGIVFHQTDLGWT